MWASRKTITELFGTTSPNVTMHFKNIFQDDELNENEVSISAKDLFKNQSEFSKESLQNSKKGGRPEQ
ncbi:MAG: hypothetical protein LBU40_01060 [Methanobrevibacter sp.]|jgi:hypothetical protein|nr:hypothetical protein [Methanobrevibacter sp.]